MHMHCPKHLEKSPPHQSIGDLAPTAPSAAPRVAGQVKPVEAPAISD